MTQGEAVVPGNVPCVLVVDDNPLDIRIATVLLQKHGMRTETAANGNAALKMMSEQLPAAVVTDLQMPELDGLTLTEEIRQRYPLVPVVLMTANGSEDIAIQALRAGAASYVPKRVLEKELAQTVEQVLQAAQVDRRRQHILECYRNLDCDLELENDPALVAPLVVHFQEHLRRIGVCDDNTKIRVGVALEEALLNAIYHGNLELSSDLRQDGSDTYQRLAAQRRYEDPYAPRRVRFRVQMRPDEVRFVIVDQGPGFDIKNMPDPTDPENMLKVSGRGLLLIRTFMDEVNHNATGNEIVMVRRRKK